MFLLIHELVGDFDLQEQSRGIDLIARARSLMLAGLDQIRAICGTVKRYLALLAAALRTDASVHGGAEALLFTEFTDDTGQGSPCKHYGILLRDCSRPAAHEAESAFPCSAIQISDMSCNDPVP